MKIIIGKRFQISINNPDSAIILNINIKKIINDIRSKYSK
jgi:hypothetical protein